MDKGKRKVIEGRSSPYPLKNPKPKVLADAQGCIVNQPCKRAKTHDQGALPSIEGANSAKVVVKFAQTLPYCHNIIWPPNVRPDVERLMVNLFLFTDHGMWGIGDAKKLANPNLPEDEKFLEDEIADRLFEVWPSLSGPHKQNTQQFWNHEWRSHGKKLDLFRSKAEYIIEGLYLNHEFDLSKFLSVIVALLRSLNHPDLLEQTYNGVRWFGVKASKLHQMLRSRIGDGVVFKCRRDNTKYLLLVEVIIVLEYDRRTMTHEVIDYSVCPDFNGWKYKSRFHDKDTIWFVTEESGKQVDSQGQRVS